MVVTAFLPLLNLVSSFGIIHLSAYQRTFRLSTSTSSSAWMHATYPSTRLCAVHSNKNNKSLRNNRISASNHRMSMKWVVESIEKVLEEEERRGTGGTNSPQDNESLTEALKKIQRGA